MKRLEPPRTHDDWLDDVRKASGDPDCYVLGTGTRVFLDDGAVYMCGLIGSFRIGTLKEDGTVEQCFDLSDHGEWGERKIIGYIDDPTETIRDAFGRAEMTPEAKAESDYDCGMEDRT